MAATALRVAPVEAPVAGTVPAPTRSLLRFITCGSVDDGKSSLIGRVLYETNAVFEDQLDALKKDSERFGTQGKNLDFALLVDGLSAEREQGITIDVAYRYFSTPNRAFIVADTPGHEQYTRNMATGASTADAAIILVDARKGLLRQTRRHSFIVSLMGVKRIIVAVNKMDLVGYDRATFEAIEADYRAMAKGLGFREITVVPVSAVGGDNVLKPSAAMPWYRGQPLVGLLETLEIEERGGARAGFVLPVQWVNRPDHDFRGFSGTVAAGSIRVGDTVTALPSGRSTTVARLLTTQGERDAVRPGEAITLVLSEEIDVSRGDVLVAGSPARAATTITADVLCTGERPLLPNGRFILKLGTATANATVSTIEHGLDIESFEQKSVPALGMNAIGRATITLDKAVVTTDYAESVALGGFILIDPMTNATAAFGFVRQEAATEEVAAPQSLGQRLTSGLSGAKSGESNARSVVKALTWRVTGSLDTFLLSFLFTASARTAAAISITEVITKIFLYYFHERIWARIGYGLEKPADRDAAQSTDGAGI